MSQFSSPAEKQVRLEAGRARRTAEALHMLIGQVFTSGKPADRLLSAYMRNHKKLGASDRRFLAEVFFSVFRWWGWLKALPGADALWAAEAQEAVSEPAEPTTAAERRHDRDAHGTPGAANNEDWVRLLLAAHQLDSQELHPAAAIWKEVLGIEDHLPGLGGIPLRQRAERFAQCWDLPTPKISALAPEWFFNDLPLSPEAREDLLAAMQERPPLWLRAQTDDIRGLLTELREARLFVNTSASVNGAIRAENPRVNLYELDAYRSGRCEIQDLASQCIGLTCAPKPGERWWDVCAGAGGKTLQLGMLMGSKGVVVATDIRAWKLQDLKRRARRAGLSNVSPREWDGSTLPAREANFDGVLVDAPCTCTGVWRRNPDARWTTKQEDIREMTTLQGGILRQAARGVKPGGLLVYATCSFCPAENEDVISAFLSEHPEFALEACANPLTGEMTSGMIRIWPQDGDCDASFTARMRRQPKAAKAGTADTSAAPAKAEKPAKAKPTPTASPAEAPAPAPAKVAQAKPVKPAVPPVPPVAKVAKAKPAPAPVADELDDEDSAAPDESFADDDEDAAATPPAPSAVAEATAKAGAAGDADDTADDTDADADAAEDDADRDDDDDADDDADDAEDADDEAEADADEDDDDSDDAEDDAADDADADADDADDDWADSEEPADADTDADEAPAPAAPARPSGKPAQPLRTRGFGRAATIGNDAPPRFADLSDAEDPSARRPIPGEAPRRDARPVSPLDDQMPAAREERRPPRRDDDRPPRDDRGDSRPSYPRRDDDRPARPSYGPPRDDRRGPPRDDRRGPPGREDRERPPTERDRDRAAAWRERQGQGGQDAPPARDGGDRPAFRRDDRDGGRGERPGYRGPGHGSVGPRHFSASGSPPPPRETPPPLNTRPWNSARRDVRPDDRRPSGDRPARSFPRRDDRAAADHRGGNGPPRRDDRAGSGPARRPESRDGGGYQGRDARGPGDRGARPSGPAGPRAGGGRPSGPGGYPRRDDRGGSGPARPSGGPRGAGPRGSGPRGDGRTGGRR